MWHVCQQGAERDRELHADRLGDLDDQAGETAPAKRRFASGEQNQVAWRPGDPGLVELDLGPRDLSRLALVQLDLWPGRLEVVELLRVNRCETSSAKRGADERQSARRGG